MSLCESTEQAEVRAAREIRNIFKRMGDDLKDRLSDIRKQVVSGGKTAIASELGADAASMLVAYDQGKALAELILDIAVPAIDK